MKKIAFLFAIIFITSFALAQDVIVTKEGKKINSKVTEINENDIRYKIFENLDGPTYTMKKSEIATIMYENGHVEVFTMSISTPPPPVQQPMPNNSIYYTKADYEKALALRKAGIGCFVGGLGGTVLGSVLFIAGALSWEYELAAAGYILMYASIPVGIAGIIMWPIAQSRLNKINRAYPNGFSLFENEKVRLNLALDGNNVGFKVNF